MFVFVFRLLLFFLIVQSPPIGVTPIFEDKQKHRMAPFSMFNEDPPKVHDLGLGHRASQCCLTHTEWNNFFCTIQGKIYRKKNLLYWKAMVSCRFSMFCPCDVHLLIDLLVLQHALAASCQCTIQAR